MYHSKLCSLPAATVVSGFEGVAGLPVALTTMDDPLMTRFVGSSLI